MKDEFIKQEEFEEIDLFAEEDSSEDETSQDSQDQDKIVLEEKEIQGDSTHEENTQNEEIQEEENSYQRKDSKGGKLEESIPPKEPSIPEVPSRPEESIMSEESTIPDELIIPEASILPEELFIPEVLSSPEESPIPKNSIKPDTPTVPEEALPPATDLNEVINSINGLSDKMDCMNKLFLGKIQHTEFEDKIVDQMHAELQKYKDDMYSRLIRPILLDIIEVRDSILRIARIYADKPEGGQDIPNKMFADYALDIQDILEKNEIEIYQSSADTTFVPVKQKAIKKVYTTTEHLHGKLAGSMSSGYTYKGRTISPEKVAVYSYQKPSEEIESED